MTGTLDHYEQMTHSPKLDGYCPRCKKANGSPAVYCCDECAEARRQELAARAAESTNIGYGGAIYDEQAFERVAEQGYFGNYQCFTLKYMKEVIFARGESRRVIRKAENMS